ncbi:hypothetical protein I4U23_024368 [Adineta vaga]|nr:hypothetical protein I4U23_024368 [Adineta vaga]
MASSNRLLASKDVNGEKWDRCLTDGVFKTASGVIIGLLFSAILFKRRPWPVFLGTGMGIGMAYSNCQNDLRSPYVNSQSISITRPDRHVPIKPSDE